MAYAATTEVPVERSLAEIVSLIKKAGANRTAQVEEPGALSIKFFLNDRLLHFTVKVPDWQLMPEINKQRRAQTIEDRQRRAAQVARQRARALLLVIKAKLESVESEVETFDEAFLANIVTPDGPTVGAWLLPQIEAAYVAGKMPNQLLLESSNG